MKIYLILVSFIFSYTQLNAQCNGMNSLCSKKYNEVAYLTTHNAFNSAQDNFNLPNQNLNITSQLNDGVRALMIDVYDDNGTTVVYHGFSFLGSAPLVDFLTEIKTFLDNNPNEIVSIIFESHTTAEAIEADIIQSNLFSYLYSHNGTWPSLQSMIYDGTRLVVFSEEDDGSSMQTWYHYIWDYTVETDYSANSLNDLDCDYNRGDPANDLFLLNHFVTSLAGTGLENESLSANSNPYFLNRVQQCYQETGKFPNFIAVDFYELGDAKSVVDQLNENTISSLRNIDNSTLSIYPNPALNYIQVAGLTKTEAYIIYDILGKELTEGTISNSEKVDIQDLSNGVYFLKIGNVKSIKFINE
ncbi:MAG: hypothetical protein ACI9O4_000113 [Chitinophagales bacterium]|jgi:hypothetical protein